MQHEQVIKVQEEMFIKMVKSLTASGGEDLPGISHQRLVDLLVENWMREGHGLQEAGPGMVGVDLTVLPSVRKSDSEPSVVVQWGTLRGVVSVEGAMGLANLFHQAAEAAIAASYLRQALTKTLGSEKGEELFREVGAGLLRHRARYGMGAPVRPPAEQADRQDGVSQGDVADPAF